MRPVGEYSQQKTLNNTHAENYSAKRSEKVREVGPSGIRKKYQKLLIESKLKNICNEQKEPEIISNNTTSLYLLQR